MYQISVEQHFDAAHYLRGYGGRCEELHGHRFQVVVRINAQALNDIGLAYDFGQLKKQLGGILARFDHCCLNDVAPFDRINPSSENIARTVYQEIKAALPIDVALAAAEVWESPDSCASYIQD